MKEPDSLSFLKRYGALVERIARRLGRRSGLQGVSQEDLVAVGGVGLLEAARRYDPSAGVKFETFAEHRVRGAMLDELRRVDFLPRRQRARTQRVVRARRKLQQALGREPTSEELAAELSVDLAQLGALELQAAKPVPLEPDLQLPSEDDSAEQLLSMHELRSALSGGMRLLAPRTKTLLAMYYLEGLTFAEIAVIMKVGKARVCQLHAEAMVLLRGCAPHDL